MACLRVRAATPPLPRRTMAQTRQFRFGMWEMTHLYGCRLVSVLVDPVIDAPEDFPLGPADIREPEEDGGSRTCSWGFINDRPYHERGWVCRASFNLRRGDQYCC